MDIDEEIRELTSDEDMRYFAHFTGSDVDSILEQGLIVGSKKWNKSFLELDSNERENISMFLEDNKRNGFSNRDYEVMILVGVLKSDVNYFIRENNDGVSSVNWEGTGNPDYIVDSRYIMGYIDTVDMRFTENEDYQFGYMR